MKKEQFLKITILLLIITTSILLSGCLTKNKKEDKTLITNFINTFYTYNEYDFEPYEEYLTSTAYEDFCIKRAIGGNLSGRFIDDVELQVLDLSIKPQDNPNPDLHSYKISFTLKDKISMEETPVELNLHLGKEDTEWKINENNILTSLLTPLIPYLKIN